MGGETCVLNLSPTTAWASMLITESFTQTKVARVAVSKLTSDTGADDGGMGGVTGDLNFNPMAVWASTSITESCTWKVAATAVDMTTPSAAPASVTKPCSDKDADVGGLGGETGDLIFLQEAVWVSTSQTDVISQIAEAKGVGRTTPSMVSKRKGAGAG